MASDVTVNTGNYGRWRGLIQLISQNQANNTSYVRVRGIVYNDGTSTSFNNNGVPVSLTNGLSYSANPAMSVPGYGGSQTLIDQYFTVTHDANGYKTQTVNVNLGDTLTGNIGGPASVSLSLVLTRIKKAPNAPTALASSAISYTAATLAWVQPSDWGGDDTDDYYLQVSTDPTFATYTQYTVTNLTSHALTGLLSGTTYYARVRGFNSVGSGDWSATHSFATTAYTAPNAPTGLAIGSISYTAGTATWNSPSNWGGDDDGTYKIQIATNNAFTGATQYLTTTRSRAFTGLTPGTTYYVRVQGYNVAGDGTWSATVSFTATAYTVPNAPTGFGTSLITTSGVTAAWTAPSDWGGNNTGTYKIQIATNSGFTGATEYTTSTPSRAFTGLSPNTTYYLRVRGYNAAGDGTWSVTISFTTATATPTAPGTPLPTVIGATNLTVTWTAPSSWGGDNTGDYELDYGTSPTFVGATTLTVLDATTREITGLTPGVTYYLRVRAINGAASTGANSSTLAVDTLSGGKVYDTTFKSAVFRVYTATGFKVGVVKVYTATGFKTGL